MSRSPTNLLRQPWPVFWLVTAVAMLAIFWPNAAGLIFRDPDDALRLVEVRNWLGGQGWFDVSQPRIAPPGGGDMHWSRFVDLPIAALTLILGERMAAVLTPLLLLGGYFALIQSILSALRPGDRVFAWVGLAVAATSLFAVQQFAPLRLDHHNWQLLLSLALFRVALAPPTLRWGMVAGALLSLHLAISLEGLPYLALFGVMAGIAYWRHAEGWPRLEGLAWSLAAGSFLLSLAGRGWDSLSARHCDAVSQPHLLAFAATAAVLITLGRALGHGSFARRIAISALAGATGLAVLAILAADCLIDPFGALDPVAYELWYRQISEGRPIWEQSPDIIAAILVQSLLGFAGTAYSLRKALATPTSSEARRWAIVLLLSGGAFLLSLWVARGMYAAHALAVPGVAALLLLAWGKARSLSGAMPRIVASVGVGLLLPVIATAALGAIWNSARKDETALETTATDSSAALASCRAPASLEPLNRLPTATIFAPLDLGPAILVATPHSVVATSHHRNDVAIRTVISGFVEGGEIAANIVRASGAKYLLTCPGIGELALYAGRHKDGLAGQLAGEETLDWLEPVALPETSPLRLYRVK